MPAKAKKPVPEGMNTVTTHLYFNNNCSEAIDLYKKVFKAGLIGNIVPGPDGKTVMHALIRIGDTHLMMADGMPGYWKTGPKEHYTASLFLYVDDCDTVYNQALAAGCTVVYEMMDTFWGDRMGTIRDPFGQMWAIATHKWELTPEEMAKGQEEWLKSF